MLSKVVKLTVNAKFLHIFVRSLCTKPPTDLSRMKGSKEPSRSMSEVGQILKNELKQLKNLDFSPPEPKFPKEVDILIIGGGIIGSSVAYWLKQFAPDSFDLLVAERDPKYTRASSVLSVGGIRQQFSLEENIQLSLQSAEFLRNIKQHLSVLDDDPPDIQFQPHGYLFLATEAGADQMIINHRTQRDLGAKVELLRPKQLAQKFPWLNLDGIVMGSYGIENEGWFDPWSLLSAFKKKAYSFGTKFINGEVVGFEFENVPLSYIDSPDASHLKVNCALIRDETGEVHPVEFCKLVVCAGAYSGEIAKMLRIGHGAGLLWAPFPVEPRKRYVYTFHCENGPGLDMPLVIDPSGVYCRREGLGGMYICGRSPEPSEEPDISNLEVDYNFFENNIWPNLAKRLPAFEAIKVSSAWAGYYDYNTLDQNALCGPHPFYPNITFVTGFSGHGIQMAPAVGKAMAEMVLHGFYKSIDLSRFGLYRLFEKKGIYEQNIV